MKKILLLLCLCITAYGYARTQTAPKTSVSKQSFKEKSEQKLQERLKELGLDYEIKSAEESIKRKGQTKPVSLKDRKISLKDVKKLNESLKPRKTTETLQRLDSVISLLNGDDNIKIHFKYNDNHDLIERTNQQFDPWAMEWSEQIFLYFYNDKGYLTEYQTITPAANAIEKQIYTYNENDLVESLVTVNYFDGEYGGGIRVAYKYGDSEYPIEQIKDYSDYEGVWGPYEKEYAAWDEYGMQTYFEKYEWINNEWRGITKEENSFYSPTQANLIRKFEWDETTKQFFPIEQNIYTRAEDDGRVLVDDKQYWNRNDNDWTGNTQRWDEEIEEYVTLYNGKVVYTYDDQKREINQVFSQNIGDKWVTETSIESIYTPAENDETQLVKNTYFYSSETERELRGILTIRYIMDDPDMSVYMFETKLINGIWQNKEESETSYNADGYIVEEKLWTFKENVKLAVLWNITEFDADNNPTLFLTYTGQETGDDDWLYYKRFEYTNENNTRMSAKEYVYYNDRWILAQENRHSLDFSVPVSQLVIPSAEYDFEYKALSQYGLTAYIDIETEEIFNEVTDMTYYYTEIEGGNSIENNTSDAQVSVYPNPVTNVLYVKADGNVKVNIYNVQGQKVLESDQREINVSSFINGIYIVDVNGVKTKVVKK